MDKRGVGVVSGRKLSAHRATVLQHLENAVKGVQFPAKRETLCRFLEGISIPLGAEGQEVEASAILSSLNIDEFSSPAHVREAVNINWEDFADVFRPGGTLHSTSLPMPAGPSGVDEAPAAEEAPDLRTASERIEHGGISRQGEGRDMSRMFVQGLLGSVGKAIASQPQNDQARKRLARVQSPDELRTVLEEMDLGVAPPAAEKFIDAVTGEDWQTFHGRLVQSVDIAFHERMAPSS